MQLAIEISLYVLTLIEVMLALWSIFKKKDFYRAIALVAFGLTIVNYFLGSNAMARVQFTMVILALIKWRQARPTNRS